MINPELVGANQLRQWPEHRERDAQDHFPELVRRLLVETPGISNISIRSGDGVALAGWDGSADSMGTSFLPAGRLAFEFGVSKDTKRKANGDYAHRVSDVSSGTVFVFLTPRRWPAAQAWASERKADKKFANVVALDADDLEGWLSASPGAHYWISEHLGLRPRDAQTIDAWWEHFSNSTEPRLPSALFLAGRSVEARQLSDRLAGPPTLTTIQTEGSSDALAFAYASALDPNADGASNQPSTILVSTADVWDRVLEQPGESILIPQFDRANVRAAIEKGHHVISIVDRMSVSRQPNDLMLPRLGRHEAQETFQKAGIDFVEADRLAVRARRSLPALVRQLSLNPSFRRPGWLDSVDSALLGSLVLIGSWTTINEDLAALEELTGVPRKEIEQVVARVSSSDDPLLRKVGNCWAFTSPEEAFLLLRDSITLTAIERWSGSLRSVLLAGNPMLDLTLEEQLSAQWRGVRPPHSGALQRGLAQGLALMGSMGSTTVLDSGLSLAQIATDATSKILASANADASGHIWHQLSDILPLLAEAAPEEFLRATEDGLTSNTEPVLLKLFHEDRESSFALGSSSPHPHLLWALETVCWVSEYLLDGVRILARLAAIVPDRKSGNSPRGSLATILCGWTRNTSAPLSVRIQAIDAVHRVSEPVGWRLILDLWPSNHSWVMPPAAPRIRDWRTSDAETSPVEWMELSHELVTRALARAGQSPDRLVQVIEGLTTVSQPDRDRIIEFLRETAEGDLGDDAQLRLWEKLRSTIARHEQFETATWAMPIDLREQLKTVASLFEPKADPQRFSYLFDWHPDLPGIDSTDLERYDAKLSSLRREVLHDVLASEGAYEHLARLAQRAAAPGQLGWALAEHQEASLVSIVPWLTSDDHSLSQAAASWVRRCAILYGPNWLKEVLEHEDVEGDARAALIRQVPARGEFWEVLHDSSQEDDEETYWSAASVEIVDPADAGVALSQLIKHERAWSAVSVAAHAVDERRMKNGEPSGGVAADVIVGVLDAAIRQAPSQTDLTQMTSYYIGQLLDYLSRSDAQDNDVARFEYTFFRLLEHDREPRVLNRVLATQPEIFVDQVKRTFYGRNEERQKRAELDEGAATQAWWVLRGWTGFPGRREDGSIDPVVMNDWVREARLQLSEVDRADIGDELIGQAFSNCPPGADGIWPAEPIRELLETIGSREIENGLLIGRMNARGVTSRGVYDGGTQERNLAQQYRAWSAAVRADWPRTARVLRDLAEAYEREAQREDIEAELHEDRQ